MHITREILAGQPVANAVLVLSLVATLGLMLAAVKVRGIGLGIAGVLFAGIGFGHFGFGIPHEILEFGREFGLILFVFTIGLQLGPGFFASLKKDGLRLNVLALAVVGGGALLSVGAAVLLKTGFPAAFGLFCGATTNTPALGAVQQALGMTGGGAHGVPGAATLAAMAYAVSYPGGVVGIIGTLLLLKSVFKIDLPKEAAAFEARNNAGVEPLERLNIEVENPNIDGICISAIPARRETGVVISRIQRAGEEAVELAEEDSMLHLGDRVLAVGTVKNLSQFRRVLGSKSAVDLMQSPGNVDFRKVLVTRREVVGRTVDEFKQLHGVSVTRITRGGHEMAARFDMALQFGDELQMVGKPGDLDRATETLGNSVKALGNTHFIPIFIGIALGVLAGAVPFQFPGVPLPVRLGIAGGPLLLAILISRLGRLGPLVLNMPYSANLAFRELGITLFLACVGLKSGAEFFSTVFTLQGGLWLLAGTLITWLPLIAVGFFARAVAKLDFMTICGLLSGSMTDPPALAFATSISGSDAPSVSYAAVYPLAMFARILVAQVLVVTFG